MTLQLVDSPAYKSKAYILMEADWTLCQDVKASTRTLRDKKDTYLPRFQSEDMQDWDARVKMTFANDYYDQTLNDCVGLIFTENPKIDAKAPQEFLDFAENVDGKGTHFEVFAKTIELSALDYGHAGIYTEYPTLPDGRRANKREAKTMNLRPYWLHIEAPNIINWRHKQVNGVKVLTKVTLKECASVPDGQFGEREDIQYRVYEQSVVEAIYPSSNTPVAVALGKITWALWTKDDKGNYNVTQTGQLKGMDQIPLRIVYGGEKLDDLVSKPFLLGLAYSNLEETQVGSDYAAVMHKCNVPTPIFKGRNVAIGTGQAAEVKMGQGIDLSESGDAKFLEPSGVALAATRQRLEDIRTQMRRQGAAVKGETAGQTMTATEANLYTRQRNARLSTAARSLQDGLENALGDVAVYMGKPRDTAPSVEVLQDFTGSTIDPQYLALVFAAWQANLIPADAALFAFKHGRLPDDFQVEDAALQAMSADQATQDALKAGKNPLVKDQQPNADQ